eukprot:CAMPEP_0113273400 /NCGR_PEP_ID=MMETSP0008_2-20120614/23831_1 /TAXON_ID=97485 /ORGANISM="Prymnesium parvum" /LENGTH=139 /DNA_ID=CAMNT_0000122915 /DNA_START=454 /DNA_END=873 /DNA_ORIENTATION=+ /assembly_acc=CAM_ASM_000153
MRIGALDASKLQLPPFRVLECGVDPDAQFTRQGFFRRNFGDRACLELCHRADDPLVDPHVRRRLGELRTDPVHVDPHEAVERDELVPIEKRHHMRLARSHAAGREQHPRQRLLLPVRLRPLRRREHLADDRVLDVLPRE